MAETTLGAESAHNNSLCRGEVFPRFLELDAILSALPSLSRPALAIVAGRSIDRLDEIDGDPGRPAAQRRRARRSAWRRRVHGPWPGRRLSRLSDRRPGR